MRLKNSFAFVHEPCNQNHTLLKVRKNQQAKIMGIMSDSEFDYDNDDTPLGLRVREQHNIVMCKVILGNQLVHPAHMKHVPTSVNVLHQCKIGQGSNSHNKIKNKYSKDNTCKVKKEKMIDLLSLNSTNQGSMFPNFFWEQCSQVPQKVNILRNIVPAPIVEE